MGLAALAYRPHAFAVGVDIFGVSNWLRTLKNTPRQIRRPWMVLQGANDGRVLKVESDEIVASVRKNTYPSNGFVKKQNGIRGNHAILELLDQRLK